MNLQFTIPGLYVLGLLGIGIWSARRIKTEGDYLVSGRRGSLLAISGSLLATILGSSAVLGTVNLVAIQGWAAIWLLLSGALGLFFLIPFSKKVQGFQVYTFPEMMEELFGPKVAQLATILIPLAWTGIVAAQFIGAAKVMAAFLPVSYSFALYSSAAIIILYTLLGGQKSVLTTDGLQSLFILLGLGSLVYYVSQFQGEIQAKAVGDFPFNEAFSPLDLLVLMGTYATTYLVGPDVYSRLFCAKDGQTARRAVMLTAFLMIPVTISLGYVGVEAIHILPDSSGKTQANIILLMQQVMPLWASGFLLAVLWSTVMSSADTTLLSASAILSLLPSPEKWSLNRLQRCKIWVVITGIVSTIIASVYPSIIGTLLLAMTIFSGGFIIPTIAGLMGAKLSEKRVIPAVIAGASIALAGKLIAINGYSSPGNAVILSAFLINAIILFWPYEKK
ncbi:MAG: sodium:solute symporter family protein [Bacteroidota bacterium]